MEKGEQEMRQINWTRKNSPCVTITQDEEQARLKSQQFAKSSQFISTGFYHESGEESTSEVL